MPEYGDDLLRGGLGPAEQLQHALLHGSKAARPAAQGDLVPAHDITVNLRWSLLSLIISGLAIELETNHRRCFHNH